MFFIALQSNLLDELERPSGEYPALVHERMERGNYHQDGYSNAERSDHRSQRPQTLLVRRQTRQDRAL